ncbi:MAG: aspartate aminotransferase family protein [Hyphomicrobiales bacterium]|nr:MAG: aspartate aminotransferase family protein [Hyphomicrobiales bacterium]
MTALTDKPSFSDVLQTIPASVSYMERARRVIPRGMTSRGRSRAVPVAFHKGEGAHLFDLDGHRYVDLVMALGPLLLGHSPTPVIDAVRHQLDSGVQFGGQHVREAELAERIVQHVPGAQKVLFSNTGSEAVQAAIRIARATTGRRIVVKFEGHYHGWIDPVFVNSPGVPAERSEDAIVPLVHNVAGQPSPTDILVCRWNDLDALQAVFDKYGADIAAVITEPIPFNLGTVFGDPGYLPAVRTLTETHGALLIFDEVVSGFRVGVGGAQAMLGVTPDLTTFAKAMAAGFPIAAIAGTDEAMASAIDGPVFHGGTYNGTPMSVAAAIATIDHLSANEATLYAHLDAMGKRLATGLTGLAVKYSIPLVVNQIGSVLQLLWGPSLPVRSFADADAAEVAPVAAISELALAEGIYAPPRGIMFISTEHTPADIDLVVAGYDHAIQKYLTTGTID